MFRGSANQRYPGPTAFVKYAKSVLFMLSSNFTCTSFLGHIKACQPIILLLFGLLLVLRYLHKGAFSKPHKMFQVRISNL